MSSALCVFIHASETGHAEGVPIAPSRGRSVEFPSKGNNVFFVETETILLVFFNKQKVQKNSIYLKQKYFYWSY